MIQFSFEASTFTSDHGTLHVPAGDAATVKLAMLLEGELGGLGPTQAAAKFDYTRQRYFQLKRAFQRQGLLALQDQTRGPKTNYRRTEVLTRLVIRHRFLDPDATAEVIAQKLTQLNQPISIRSVQRVIADYGLQKKTLRP